MLVIMNLRLAVIVAVTAILAVSTIVEGGRRKNRIYQKHGGHSEYPTSIRWDADNGRKCGYEV